MQQQIMRPAGQSKRPLSRRFVFSKERLAAIKPPTNGRASYVYDTRTPHLVYCVTSRGNTLYQWYGRINGRPMRHTLGTGEEMTPDQAREAAVHVTADKLKGVNPIEKKREQRRAAADAAAKHLTFGQLFTWYETTHTKPNKSSWKNDRQLYETHVKKWANRPADEIRQADLKELHAKLKEQKKPVTGNRLLSMVSKMYNTALADKAMNFRADNPAKGIDRHEERSRDEWIKTDAQLKAFIAALELEPSETMRDFFKLCLWTGARRSNVLSMRWDEIDLAGRLWVIPAEKAKARENINVPLSAPAMEILERRRRNQSEWVLPSHSASGHLCEPKKAWADLIERANMPRLHLHDLRRTYASWLVRNGASIQTIKSMMGHKDIKTTEIYAKSDLEAMRSAANVTAGAMVAAIAPPTPAKKTGRLKAKEKSNRKTR